MECLKIPPACIMWVFKKGRLKSPHVPIFGFILCEMMYPILHKMLFLVPVPYTSPRIFLGSYHVNLLQELFLCDTHKKLRYIQNCSFTHYIFQIDIYNPISNVQIHLPITVYGNSFITCQCLHPLYVHVILHIINHHPCNMPTSENIK